MIPEPYASRIARVRDGLEQHRTDWVLVPASTDFRWLTGASARSTERLVVLGIARRGDPFCLAPRLEAASLAIDCPWLALEPWDESDDPLQRLSRRIGLDRRPSLFLGEGWRTTPLLALASATACAPASVLLPPLRAIKDAEEVRAMEVAGTHADEIVEAVAAAMRPGMTEHQVARMAMERFEAIGDTDPWAIAASGPNSALPHHHPGDRALLEGDVVVLDVGASTHGYSSDITRTYWLGAPPPDAAEVYAIVDRARAAGIAASRPGQTCESVDRAARDIIAAAGYGEYFIHRTGHGVGADVHELPYLVAGNSMMLAAGMAHSVEPGIYLPGRFGVRIEDLVIVEPSGARPLNRAPHDPRPPQRRA